MTVFLAVSDLPLRLLFVRLLARQKITKVTYAQTPAEVEEDIQKTEYDAFVVEDSFARKNARFCQSIKINATCFYWDSKNKISSSPYPFHDFTLLQGQEFSLKSPTRSSLKPRNKEVFNCIAIGISTGGPKVLHEVIKRLPSKLDVPIFIVQHMPPNFTKALANSLHEISKYPVQECEDNMEAKAGNVYLAQGGQHMVVAKGLLGLKIRLSDSACVNSCKPAVDVLFKSIASTLPDWNILAMILTGMGRDGLEGVRALKKNKCFCISQSEKSCAVYGMPRVVAEAGLSDLALSIEDIGVFMQKSLFYKK